MPARMRHFRTETCPQSAPLHPTRAVGMNMVRFVSPRNHRNVPPRRYASMPVWRLVTLVGTVALLLVSFADARAKPAKPKTNQPQFKDPDDYYSILGLKKTCRPKEIKSAYRKLALQYHPDKIKDEADKPAAEEKFILISQAYAVLSEPEKRKIYDTYGKSGLDASERGQDPESAGFGFGSGSGGGSNSGFGGGSGFHFKSDFGGGGFDAFKMFEQMFQGGGSPGGGGGAQFQFNSGGFGSGFGSGGGFNGGNGFGRPHAQPKPKPKADLFSKHATPNIVKLGSPKFPNAQSKNLWLIVFYDNEAPACETEAKPVMETLTSKVKSSFKLGAVDCGKSTKEGKFCQSHVQDRPLPVYAFVRDATVTLFPDTRVTAKALYEFAIQHMPQDLIHNINHPSQILQRLTGTSSEWSVLLLTDKYETSPLYMSLAYQYRHSKVWASFGESRAKNLPLGQMLKVKKYPHLVALVPKAPTADGPKMHTVVYKGDTKSVADISKWLDETARHIQRNQTSQERNSFGL